jgi:hypothetical protein
LSANELEKSQNNAAVIRNETLKRVDSGQRNDVETEGEIIGTYTEGEEGAHSKTDTEGVEM